MDQFSAHLDRGWDLVQRGDARGAEHSARRALELDDQSPEAYNLLGYVAHIEGDYDEAVDHYRHAIALDDGYLDAMLNAAEVYIHPLQDFDEAVGLCDQVLEVADTDGIRVDALLLKFDALLAQDRGEDAQRLCNSFPAPPYENPSHTFLVGRARYEVGDVAGARTLIAAAVEADPSNPDAAYYLGLILDEAGELRAATDAFLRARELDLDVPPAPWSLSLDTFELTARRAIDGLPENLRGILEEEEVYVADGPGLEVVVDGVDPRALLLIDAVAPAPDPDAPSPDEGQAIRARLFLYQRNIERLAGAMENLEPEIRAALERELTAMVEHAEHAAQQS